MSVCGRRDSELGSAFRLEMREVSDLTRKYFSPQCAAASVVDNGANAEIVKRIHLPRVPLKRLSRASNRCIFIYDYSREKQRLKLRKSSVRKCNESRRRDLSGESFFDGEDIQWHDSKIRVMHIVNY